MGSASYKGETATSLAAPKCITGDSCSLMRWPTLLLGSAGFQTVPPVWTPPVLPGLPSEPQSSLTWPLTEWTSWLLGGLFLLTPSCLPRPSSAN